MREIARRLYVATTLLVLVVLFGTAVIHAIGRGRWTWFQSLFHTVITLSTVGYGELPGMENDPVARSFSLALILLGAGTMVYFASVVTALLVEGELRDLLRKNRMKKGIDNLERHIIVCGIGRTGHHVVKELIATQTPFVCVDADADKMALLREEMPGLPYVVGDATEDDVLAAAGIARARGVVAALSDDRDNLYVTLTARSLNPALRIIAKAVEASAEPKLRKAGADKVVTTNMIGGLRLASEMIRPNVTEFLDIMLRDPAHVLRIEEATVPAWSALVGKTLGACQLRKVCDVLVIAVRTRDQAHKFNPGAEHVLEGGSTLIVLGERGEIAKLRARVEESG
jgi:voltage-gated potassium channel